MSVDVTFDSRKIYISFQYNVSIVEWIKSNIYGRKWNTFTKQWEAPILNRNLRLLFENNNVTNESKMRIKNLAKILKKDTLAAEKKLKVKFPFLREYQIKDVATYFYPLSILNANEMGLGKTWETAAYIRYRNKGVYLVICPSTLMKQWSDELLNPNFNIKSFIFDGPPKKRTVVLEEFIDKAKKFSAYTPVVLIMNYEKLLTQDINKLIAIMFDAIIFDEITRLKNYKTQTNQRARTLNSRKVIGLTGTPIENSVEDLYNIMEVISPGFFDSFNAFAREYLISMNFGYKQKHDAGLLIAERLKKYKGFIRWKKENVLSELPELSINNVLINLDENEYSNYLDIENEIIIEYDAEKDRVVTNITGIMTKLRRFCSDPKLYVPNLSNYGVGSKLTWFEDIVKFLPENSKLFAISEFSGVVKNYEERLSLLGIPCITVTGDDTTDIKNAKLDKMKEKNSKILISTDCLAHGTNLQYIDYLVNIDVPWNPAILDQRIARLHRMGQQNKVTVYNLFCANTIEQDVSLQIASKRVIFEQAIGSVEKLIDTIKSRKDESTLKNLNMSNRKKILDLAKKLKKA